MGGDNTTKSLPCRYPLYVVLCVLSDLCTRRVVRKACVLDVDRSPTTILVASNLALDFHVGSVG